MAPLKNPVLYVQRSVCKTAHPAFVLVNTDYLFLSNAWHALVVGSGTQGIGHDMAE